MQIIETVEQARDRILGEWNSAKQALEGAKAHEMELRKAAFAIVFSDNANVGTNRIPLANGWHVKGVRKVNYSLSKDMVSLNTAYDAVCKLGNEGSFLAERLLKRVYELGEGEFKKLDPTNPTHAQILSILNPLVTTSDGAPTLEIEPPKEKK